jgi:hypothetical protein
MLSTKTSRPEGVAYVRFGLLADICSAKRHVRFTPESGHVPATGDVRYGPKADKRLTSDAHFPDWRR